MKRENGFSDIGGLLCFCRSLWFDVLLSSSATSLFVLRGANDVTFRKFYCSRMKMGMMGSARIAEPRFCVGKRHSEWVREL